MTVTPTYSTARAYRAHRSEYNCWRSMRRRCNNTRPSERTRYHAARGIRVCERWDSFANFFADMGPKPTPRHSLDRIDSNGNYEPDNCRWATPREQVLNSRGGTLTHCKRGHQREGNMIKNSKGIAGCRLCQRVRDRARAKSTHPTQPSREE